MPRAGDRAPIAFSPFFVLVNGMHARACIFPFLVYLERARRLII